MNRPENEPDVDALLREALRELIGEKRFSTWFGAGVRFVLSETGLTVRVETSEFLCNWLRSTFGHDVEQLSRDFFGRAVPIEFVYAGADSFDANDFNDSNDVADAGSKGVFSNDSLVAPFVGSRAAERPAEILRFPETASVRKPAWNAETAESRGIPEIRPFAPIAEFPESADFATPPKRRRGRPRKNPLPTHSSQTPQIARFPQTPSIYCPPQGEPSIASPTAPAPQASQAPRRRGRPRKNPLPPQPAQTFQNAPSVPLAQTALNAQTAPFAQTSSAEPNPAWGLSEEERVSWAAGDFGAPSPFANVAEGAENEGFARNANSDGRKPSVEPSNEPGTVSNRAGIPASFFQFSQTRSTPQSLQNSQTARPTQPSSFVSGTGPRNLFGEEDEFPTTAPRKRGRPKGSTAASRRGATLFDGTQDDADEASVSRDASGANFVRKAPTVRPIESPNAGPRWASLDSFVEGFSNRLTLQILGVALTEPGKLNPIFVHGPTSVGKTHLLEGVCDKFRRVPGRKPPLYMTSEEFTSAFVQSLRGGGPFRDRFRNISLFALDDVHFLEGKLTTQTELLNVVDALRARRVQMIFSANRALSEMTKLRGELTTRLESGVDCKIEPPERETLLKIFERMAVERGIDVPDDVCRFVVSRFATHARRLSGALNRLYAAHLTTGAPIDVQMAQTALADLIATTARVVRLEDVERVVRETFGLEPTTLKSKSRAKRCADPRALAMWLARKHTRAALVEIGDFFGGRQHSAVLAAQKKVDDWLAAGETIEGPESEEPVSVAIERMERELAAPRN